MLPIPLIAGGLQGDICLRVAVLKIEEAEGGDGDGDEDEDRNDRPSDLENRVVRHLRRRRIGALDEAVDHVEQQQHDEDGDRHDDDVDEVVDPMDFLGHRRRGALKAHFARRRLAHAGPRKRSSEQQHCKCCGRCRAKQSSQHSSAPSAARLVGRDPPHDRRCFFEQFARTNRADAEATERRTHVPSQLRAQSTSMPQVKLNAAFPRVVASLKIRLAYACNLTCVRYKLWPDSGNTTKTSPCLPHCARRARRPGRSQEQRVPNIGSPDGEFCRSAHGSLLLRDGFRSDLPQAS